MASSRTAKRASVRATTAPAQEREQLLAEPEREILTPKPVYTYSGDEEPNHPHFVSAPYLTVDGQPLHYYVLDAPGSAPAGNNMSGVWHAYTDRVLEE